MNHIVLRGKATSECGQKKARTKENMYEDMTTLVIIAPVQGAPKIECQVELRSIDPKVTRVMKTIKPGDQVLAVGNLATTFKYEKNEETAEMERKPVFYWVLADQVEKIIG